MIIIDSWKVAWAYQWLAPTRARNLHLHIQSNDNFSYVQHPYIAYLCLNLQLLSRSRSSTLIFFFSFRGIEVTNVFGSKPKLGAKDTLPWWEIFWGFKPMIGGASHGKFLCLDLHGHMIFYRTSLWMLHQMSIAKREKKCFFARFAKVLSICHLVRRTTQYDTDKLSCNYKHGL